MKTLLSILLIFYAEILFAQTTLKILTGSNINSAERYTNEMLQAQKLFYNFDNIVYLYPSSQNTDCKLLLVGKGEITKIESNKYLVHVDSNQTSVTIKVVNSDQSTYQQIFNTENVDFPKAFFGRDFRSGQVTKPQLLMCNMIVVRYIDMPYDVPVYSVDSYRFVFIPRNGLTVKKKITGNKISDDEKEILKKALEGDKIIISEIKISSPNEKSILLKDKIELVVN